LKVANPGEKTLRDLLKPLGEVFGSSFLSKDSSKPSRVWKSLQKIAVLSNRITNFPLEKTLSYERFLQTLQELHNKMNIEIVYYQCPTWRTGNTQCR